MPGSRSVFECLILGDSIGLGTARAINAKYAPQCDALAAERVHAHQILGWRFPTKKYGACVFSVGSNDDARSDLAARLTSIRIRTICHRVIWLLPYSRQHAYIVNSVAATYADETIDLLRFPTRDRIHPTRYDLVARVLLWSDPD